MPEWLVVAVVGAAGGLLSTFLPTGTDVPVPPLLRDIIGDKRELEFTYHLVRNTLFGGLASFLLWGGYNPGATFDSTHITVQQVVASIIVGGGGTGTVNSLFRQAQQAKAIDTLSDSVDRLAARIEQQEATGEKDGDGGEANESPDRRTD